MIPFNKPPYVGTEPEYMMKAISNRKICGDGEFTKKCNTWIEEKTGTSKALLTTSCTQALEMAALLTDIEPGDEVIMPSFTFVSTANAFVMRGARIVFVDIRPDTQNIDEKLIENAITDKTKAIVPVHYAGVGCEMDTILEIGRKHGIVEDAHAGDWHRQISLLAEESVDTMRALSPISLGAGVFAENINTVGIDLKHLPIGTHLRTCGGKPFYPLLFGGRGSSSSSLCSPLSLLSAFNLPACLNTQQSMLV